MSKEQTQVRLVHEVPAGTQFTGAAPDGIERDTRNNGFTKHWTTVAAAGLMDPVPDRKYPIEVKRIALVLDGNTSAWSITIYDGSNSGNDPVLLSGTNETNVVVTDPQLLVPGQNLRVLTTGATAAISAEIIWDRSDLDA